MRVQSPLQKKNALILLALTLGALPFGWRVVASIALGGAIQIVNSRMLERSAEAIVRTAQATQQGRGVQALIVLRLVALLGVVGAVLLSVPVEPLAFALGLSTLVPAALWHGLATRPQDSSRGLA